MLIVLAKPPSSNGVVLKLDNKYNEKMTLFLSFSATYFSRQFLLFSGRLDLRFVLFSAFRQIQLPFVIRTDIEILFFTASFSMSSKSLSKRPLRRITPPSFNCCSSAGS